MAGTVQYSAILSSIQRVSGILIDILWHGMKHINAGQLLNPDSSLRSPTCLRMDVVRKRTIVRGTFGCLKLAIFIIYLKLI